MNTIQNYRPDYNLSMKGNLSKIAKMKNISEVEYDKLIASMPKTKEGLIDEQSLDEEDKEVLNKLKVFKRNFVASVDGIKKYFQRKITTNEKQEIYNGHNATVRRNLSGEICAVKTEAQTEKEAAKELGLKQVGILVKYEDGTFSYYFENYKDLIGTPLYEAQYPESEYGQQGIRMDHFTWDAEKKEMQLDCYLLDSK